MNRLEQLRQITDNTLYELKADETLKFRILQKAVDPSKCSGRSVRVVPMLCSLLAVLLICVFALNTLHSVPSVGPGEINVFAAGKSEADSARIFPDYFDCGYVVSVTFDQSITVTDPDQCAVLVQILLEQSEAMGNRNDSSGPELVLADQNGTTCIFSADPPYLIDKDNQCWSCESFFSALNQISNIR